MLNFINKVIFLEYKKVCISECHCRLTKNNFHTDFSLLENSSVKDFCCRQIISCGPKPEKMLY